MVETIATIKKQVSWEEAVATLACSADRLELARACYFDRPVLDAVKRFYASLEWREMCRFVPMRKSGLALDIGAGNGITSYALAMDGWHVDATEPDPSEWVGAGAIRSWAASESLPVSVCDAFCESLPFSNASFDVIIARQVMHHTKDLAQAFREISRVLAPGGIALTTRDHVVSSDKQLQQFFERHPLHKLYGGENAFRLSEYKRAAREAGLRILKVLGSISSPINLAPFSEENIVEKLSRRLPAPLKPIVTSILAPKSRRLKAVLRIASCLDNRPGRLVSLVLTK